MELGTESIGMHDSGGFVSGDCDEVAGGVGPDHEQPFLAVVLSSRRSDLHTRKPYLYECENVKVTLTLGLRARPR